MRKRGDGTGALQQADDEGYESLLERPPTLAEMRDCFVTLRNQIEVEAASERLRP
jgi:hypothetical protein